MKQVMIVTGASRASAPPSPRSRPRVVTPCVNYKSRADRAQAVVDAIRAQGGTAVAVGADVSTEAGILALFSATDRELGPVAALVNNAGILETQMRVEQMDAARLQRASCRPMWSALPVRPRGGAPDVHAARRRGRRHRQCVLGRRAPGFSW